MWLSYHLHGHFSQCYFVHRHLQQYIIQATSFSNLAIIASKAFFLNKLPVKEKNYCFQSYLRKKSCRWCFSLQVIQWPPFSSPASGPVFTHTSQIFIIFPQNFVSIFVSKCNNVSMFNTHSQTFNRDFSSIATFNCFCIFQLLLVLVISAIAF